MLAPESAGRAERRLDEAAEMRLAAVPAALPASAWCVDDIPESWLGVLAWALSIEYWDPDWTAAQRREAIRAAVEEHRLKGTEAGVRRALERAGAVYTYSEPDAFTCSIEVHNIAALGAAGLAGLVVTLERVKRASVMCTVTAPARGLPETRAAFAAGAGAVMVRAAALPLHIRV